MDMFVITIWIISFLNIVYRNYLEETILCRSPLKFVFACKPIFVMTKYQFEIITFPVCQELQKMRKSDR